MKDTTTTHIIQVVGANATALGITFTNINQALTALSLCLATSYTIYRFIADLRKNEKNENPK